MVDSNNKILAWQLLISAIVGIVWGVMFSLGDAEGDFFFDLPIGFLQGFLIGLVVVIVLAIVAGIVWALVRMFSDKPEGGFGGAMTANLDTLGASGPVQSYSLTIASWRQSPVAWGIAWGVGSAVVWLFIAALVWSSGVEANVGTALALIIGIVVGIVINLGYGVIGDLPSIVGEGYSWMESILDRGKSMFKRKRPTWEFGAVTAFGLTGLLAFIGADIGLSIFTFVFIVTGAFLGQIVKALKDAA